jgi:hypothetical protein
MAKGQRWMGGDLKAQTREIIFAIQSGFQRTTARGQIDRYTEAIQIRFIRRMRRGA